MNEAKFFLSSIIIFIIYKTVVNARKNKTNVRFTALWLAFWVLSLLVVLNPYSLIDVAHMVGIGRGVDLALYLSVLLLFYLVYKLLIKVSNVEMKITELTRKDALQNADKHKRSKQKKSK